MHSTQDAEPAPSFLDLCCHASDAVVEHRTWTPIDVSTEVRTAAGVDSDTLHVEVTAVTSAIDRNLDGGSKQRPIFMTVIASLVGMGATVGLLIAGGVTALYMLFSILETLTYAVIDVAVIVNDKTEEGDPPTSAIIRDLIAKRGLCWLAIGVVQGPSIVLWYVWYDPNSTVWQPEPMAWALVWYGCHLFIIFGVMKVHYDRRQNGLKWLVAVYCSQTLRDVGLCSPYVFIATLGRACYVISYLPGTYFLVFVCDNKAERIHVKNTYKMGICIIAFGVLYISLQIACAPLTVVGRSMVHVAFHFVAVKALIPVSKLGFGDNERQNWSYIVPAVLLGLELGPCVMFIRSAFDDTSFWLLLFIQELNSVSHYECA